MLKELEELNDWPVSLYIVGGYVRDKLLGLSPKDIDICSSLLPQEVISFCGSKGIKAIVTNESHLVVTIELDSIKVEHTTFRKESNCNGVHANVTPSTMSEDVNRRDISINALLLNKEGEIVDLVGGLEDISNKVVRIISSHSYGSEKDRLWEHGGRLFRIARFLSSKCKGWTIDYKSLEACQWFSSKVLKEKRGKVESFLEEWSKCDWTYDYLEWLNHFKFLKEHNLTLPNQEDFSNEYALYSLWVASNRPDLKKWSKVWKLTKDQMLTIEDLDKGSAIENEHEWITTSFRRLSPLKISSFFNQEFRVLEIPSQADIAKEGFRHREIKEEWIRRIKLIYSS